MPFTSRVDKTQKEFKYKRGAGFVLDKSVISLKTTTVANSMIGNVLNWQTRAGAEHSGRGL